MTRVVVALVAVAALAACGQQARSYAWYKAHPADAATVTADCGASRTDDCANAEKALADLKYEQRMTTYRKAF